MLKIKSIGMGFDNAWILDAAGNNCHNGGLYNWRVCLKINIEY